MPRFTSMSKELQRKVRELEHLANELGKEDPQTKALWRELGKSEVICGALKKKGEEYSTCYTSPTTHSIEIHKNPRCGTHGGLIPAHDDLPEESKLARLKNLRPTASMVHGLYAEESNFVASLTDSEIEFMSWLDSKVRENYEVEEGLGDVVLEGLIHDAVLHFRLLNSGRLEKGSKHTAKPLMDLMKACKEMGWTKKEKESKGKHQDVLEAWLSKVDSYSTPQRDEEESNDLH